MTRLLLLSCALALCAEPVAAQPEIFLVRHAEKAAEADTKDPDLSAAGRARADALAHVLRDAGIASVFATEFKRTQQTADPIARALHVEVTILPANDIDTLVSRLRENRGNVLVVGHSNTLPEIIKRLEIDVPVAIGESDYDDLYMLTRGEKPRLLRLHY